jgi:hypothetical protein
MPRPKPPDPPPRNQRGPRERDARSRAVQRIAAQEMLRGSLVPMERTCGKKNCRCQQGEKHVSLYLAVRRGERRVMIYIPKALEETVRRWVETGQEVEGLLEAISQECLQTLLAKKEEALVRKRKKEKPP